VSVGAWRLSSGEPRPRRSDGWAGVRVSGKHLHRPGCASTCTQVRVAARLIISLQSSSRCDRPIRHGRWRCRVDSGWLSCPTVCPIASSSTVCRIRRIVASRGARRLTPNRTPALSGRSWAHSANATYEQAPASTAATLTASPITNPVAGPRALRGSGIASNASSKSSSGVGAGHPDMRGEDSDRGSHGRGHGSGPDDHVGCRTIMISRTRRARFTTSPRPRHPTPLEPTLPTSWLRGIPPGTFGRYCR
jgi:hypothetical protein